LAQAEKAVRCLSARRISSPSAREVGWTNVEQGDAMMRREQPFVLVLAAAALMVVGGCAKRPAVSAAAAPAPTAAAPAAPPTPPAPAEVTQRAPEPAPQPAPAAAPPTVVETARPAPPPAEFKLNDNLKTIYFDFDKADIRKGDADILRANARWLNDNPGELLLIEGHCDERGTNEYNLALGERRARATMNFLVAQGVASGRVSIVSYGEERPVCTDHSEACWEKNRRAMFLTKPQ